MSTASYVKYKTKQTLQVRTVSVLLLWFLTVIMRFGWDKGSFPSFQNSTNWIAIALKNLPTIKLIFDVLCPNPWAIWRVGELVNQSANHSQPKCWIFFLWVDHLDLQKAKLYILETRLIFCNIGWITNIFGDFSGANLCESPLFSIYTRCPKKSD